MYSCVLRSRYCSRSFTPAIHDHAKRIIVRRRPLLSVTREQYSSSPILLSLDNYQQYTLKNHQSPIRCFSTSAEEQSRETPKIRATPGKKVASKSADKPAAKPADKPSNPGSVASDTASARRRKLAIRQRRKLLRGRRKSASTSQENDVWSPIMMRERSAFSGLYDRLASHYSLNKLEDAIQKIQVAENSKNQDDSSIAVLHRMLKSANPTSGAKIAFLEFLLSSSEEAPLNNTKPSEDSLAPSLKELGLRDHVDIFVAARERGLSQQLFWCNRDGNEASEMSRTDRDRIVQGRLLLHNHKTEDQLQQDSSVLVRFLHDALPAKVYRSVVSMFADYVSAAKKAEQKDQKVFAMRKVSANLEKRAPSHYHLIASRVADFFYMNEGLDYNVIDDEEYNWAQSKTKWETSKSKIVDALMDIQDKLLDSVESSDVIVSSATDEASEEEVAASESEQELNISPTIVEPVKRDHRYRKPSHMTFEAMVLQEVIEQQPNSVSEVGENMVFLENLPIDVSEEEVLELYSRCGEIETVEIYNKRVDLDPGPLNKTQLQDRRRSKMKTVRTNFRKWQRPRTPVYGLVTFANGEGHSRALDDPLLIFGMIIRRHPVRSIRASQMRSLYLENVPEGIPCMDFEYRLCQKLYPDLFVCLDAGQNNKAIVGSCEIKFPSFEMALKSYLKLQELDIVQSENPNCFVNWMQTPRDAEQWWTRALGFGY
jgi:hypothetical protein